MMIIPISTKNSVLRLKVPHEYDFVQIPAAFDMEKGMDKKKFYEMLDL
jgi:hypothetical protein